jgi:hypothetical protein
LWDYKFAIISYAEETKNEKRQNMSTEEINLQKKRELLGERKGERKKE